MCVGCECVLWGGGSVHVYVSVHVCGESVKPSW